MNNDINRENEEFRKRLKKQEQDNDLIKRLLNKSMQREALIKN